MQCNIHFFSLSHHIHFSLSLSLTHISDKILSLSSLKFLCFTNSFCVDDQSTDTLTVPFDCCIVERSLSTQSAHTHTYTKHTPNTNSLISLSLTYTQTICLSNLCLQNCSLSPFTSSQISFLRFLTSVSLTLAPNRNRISTIFPLR